MFSPKNIQVRNEWHTKPKGIVTVVISTMQGLKQLVGQRIQSLTILLFPHASLGHNQSFSHQDSDHLSEEKGLIFQFSQAQIGTIIQICSHNRITKHSLVSNWGLSQDRQRVILP